MVSRTEWSDQMLYGVRGHYYLLSFGFMHSHWVETGTISRGINWSSHNAQVDIFFIETSKMNRRNFSLINNNDMGPLRSIKISTRADRPKDINSNIDNEIEQKTPENTHKKPKNKKG